MLSSNPFSSYESLGSSSSSSGLLSKKSKLSIGIIAGLALVSLVGTAVFRTDSAAGAAIARPDLRVKRSIVSRASLTPHAQTKFVTVELGTPQYPSMPYKDGTYDNAWDGPLDITRVGGLCEVHSEHDNSKEDRRFAFGWCKPTVGAAEWGTVTYLADTTYRSTWTRTCANNQFLIGIRSDHDNGQEDRIWKFRCAEFNPSLPEDYVQGNCEWDATWVNSYDAKFTKTCPAGKVMAGVSSTYSTSTRDRLFKFECCNIGYHRDIEETVCHHYTAQTTITKNQMIFPSVRYASNMRISFFVTINSGSKFGNVLQLGKGNEDEWPAIFFNTGEPPNFLDFTFSKEGDDGEAIGRLGIDQGKEYFVEVVISDLTATLRLEGKDMRTVAIPASVKPGSASNMPVFASSDWNAAASGKIRDVEICSSDGVMPPPCFTCQKIDGPIPVKKGFQIMMAEIGENYDVNFYLNVAKGSPTGAVLQIGNSATDAAPLVTYKTNGYLNFQFEVTGGTKYTFDYNAQVKVDTDTLVQIKMRRNSFEVLINGGVLKYSRTITSTARLYGSEVYVNTVGAWSTAIATATVRDIQVCSL